MNFIEYELHLLRVLLSMNFIGRAKSRRYLATFPWVMKSNCQVSFVPGVFCAVLWIWYSLTCFWALALNKTSLPTPHYRWFVRIGNSKPKLVCYWGFYRNSVVRRCFWSLPNSSSSSSMTQFLHLINKLPMNLYKMYALLSSYYGISSSISLI